MIKQPLRALIVEDEGLLALNLESVLEEAGHIVVGWATNMRDAKRLVATEHPDIAFVDIHLSDGETGTEIAQYVRDTKAGCVVFMTANPRLVPPDFVGAIGVIAKPYTIEGINQALRFLHEGMRSPPPRSHCPSAFQLAPNYRERWATA